MTIFKSMKDFKEVFSIHKEPMDDLNCRVIISLEEIEICCMYFTIPKKGWTNKPIMASTWVCVDVKYNSGYGEQAKEYLFSHIESPKDLIKWAQDILREGVQES